MLSSSSVFLAFRLDPQCGFGRFSRAVRHVVLSSILASTIVGFSTAVVPAQDMVFRRGDANGDSRLDVSDAILMLDRLFLGRSEASCADAMDSNDDGRLDLSDAISLLGYLFLGEAVQGAGHGCDVDESPDELRCYEYAACRQPDRFFEVIDGYAVIEGDIAIGTVDDVVAGLARGEGGGASLSAGGRWPDGVVPFVIDGPILNARVGTPLATLRTRINAAIAHWEQNTPVRFFPRNNEPDFLIFEVLANPLGACGISEHVGMAGGEQFIRLAAMAGNTASEGCVIHEIGHAVGLHHEQGRSDRDQYVDVLWDNIRDGDWYRDQFRPRDGVECGPYDYSSVMHYSSQAFADPGCSGSNCTTIDSPEPIGQRRGLSDGDVLGVELRYGAIVNPCDCAGALATGSPAALGRGGNLSPGSTIDLVVLDLRWRAEMTYPLAGGFVVPVTIAVSNTGGALARSARIVVTSGDGLHQHVFVPMWRQVPEDPAVCVAPGDVVEVSGYVRFDDSALGTVQSIRAVVDGYDDVFETNESNNVSLPLTIDFPDACEIFEDPLDTRPPPRRQRVCWQEPPPQPDLVVVSVDEIETGSCLDEDQCFLAYHCTVANRGDAPASDFEVGVVVDGRGVVESLFNSLEPGEVKNLRIRSLSSLCADGYCDFELCITVDHRGRVDESNESNNTTCRHVVLLD